MYITIKMYDLAIMEIKTTNAFTYWRMFVDQNL